MKAARFHGRATSASTTCRTRTSGPGQVQVSVDWCGICGSDLHDSSKVRSSSRRRACRIRSPGAEMPIVMGHEFAGVVSAVGSGRHRRLTRATGSPSSPIRCAARARPARPGATTSVAAWASSGCRVTRVGSPSDASSTHGGSTPWLPATDVGALVEPLAVGYHAVRLSGPRAGGTAAVFGAGPIGLVTAASLKAVGAGQVISWRRPPPGRRRRPGRCPRGLDPTETNVPAAVRELTGGAGVDVAFECAGIDAVLATAIGSVRPGARS